MQKFNKKSSCSLLYIIELTSAENGAVVFCSSSGKQSSLEKDAWGNGAFTKAVVEGLEGKADIHPDKIIRISELETYIYERVKEITMGRQSPVRVNVLPTNDLTIAVVQE